MEREAFFSGYCRQVDGSRTVTVEADGSTLTEVDCCYDSCVYRQSCPIGQNISEFLKI